MRIFLVILAGFFIASAMLAASEPEPNKTEFLLTTGAGFQLSKEKGAVYGMSYQVRSAFPADIFGVALFEDPSDPDKPLKKEFKVAADAKEIRLQSQGLRTVQNDHVYSVKLMLYLDPEHTDLLSEHDQDVLFNVPEAMVDMVRENFGVDVQ
jgi:hypothetical protein